LISLTTAERLGWSIGRRTEYVRGLGDRISSVYRFDTKTVDLADQHFKDLTIGVSNLKAWKIRGVENRSIDGWLGQDIIERGQAIIDCENHRLYLRAKLPE
jgi:hypothetical protein